jgi:hypothetical protein
LWDMVLSEHGDLIIAGNRDLQGISGIDLVNQRIRMRLRVHRGTWFYDENDTFGSNLYQIIGKAPASGIQVESYVREALRPMDDISITEIDSEYNEDTKSYTVRVGYQTKELSDEIGFDLSGEAQEVSVTVPIVGIGR